MGELSSRLMTGICWKNKRGYLESGPCLGKGTPRNTWENTCMPLAPYLMPGATLTLCLLLVGVLIGESHGEANLIPHSSYSSRVLPVQKRSAFIFPGHFRRRKVRLWKGKGALWVSRALPGGNLGCRLSHGDQKGCNWISYMFWDISYFWYFGSENLVPRGIRKLQA